MFAQSSADKRLQSLVRELVSAIPQYTSETVAIEWTKDENRELLERFMRQITHGPRHVERLLANAK
jgi:hypothetical protein